MKWIAYLSYRYFRRDSGETMWSGKNCRCFPIGTVILFFYIWQQIANFNEKAVLMSFFSEIEELENSFANVSIQNH